MLKKVMIFSLIIGQESIQKAFYQLEVNLEIIKPFTFIYHGQTRLDSRRNDLTCRGLNF